MLICPIKSLWKGNDSLEGCNFRNTAVWGESSPGGFLSLDPPLRLKGHLALIRHGGTVFPEYDSAVCKHQTNLILVWLKINRQRRRWAAPGESAITQLVYSSSSGSWGALEKWNEKEYMQFQEAHQGINALDFFWAACCST